MFVLPSVKHTGGKAHTYRASSPTKGTSFLYPFKKCILFIHSAEQGEQSAAHH
jgi:hypothetical protein